MGCFLEAPRDGDASPAAVCRLVRACSSNSPSCEGKICPVDSLILSYQLDVPCHPERCPKKDTFWSRPPLFEWLSNFVLFQIVKRKISQAVRRRWQSVYYGNRSGKELEGRQLVRIKSIDRERLSFSNSASGRDVSGRLTSARSRALRVVAPVSARLSVVGSRTITTLRMGASSAFVQASARRRYKSAAHSVRY